MPIERSIRPRLSSKYLFWERLRNEGNPYGVQAFLSGSTFDGLILPRSLANLSTSDSKVKMFPFLLMSYLAGEFATPPGSLLHLFSDVANIILPAMILAGSGLQIASKAIDKIHPKTEDYTQKLVFSENRLSFGAWNFDIYRYTDKQPYEIKKDGQIITTIKPDQTVIIPHLVNFSKHFRELKEMTRIKAMITDLREFTAAIKDPPPETDKKILKLIDTIRHDSIIIGSSHILPKKFISKSGYHTWPLAESPLPDLLKRIYINQSNKISKKFGGISIITKNDISLAVMGFNDFVNVLN